MARSSNDQITTVKKKAMVEALTKSLGNVTAACKAVGIFRSTHYDWLEADAEYLKAVQDIFESSIDFAETSLFSQIKDGNTAATIFYLKTRGRHRGYIERQDVDHSGTAQVTIINDIPRG